MVQTRGKMLAVAEPLGVSRGGYYAIDIDTYESKIRSGSTERALHAA
jgi:hypothetical protein